MIGQLFGIRHDSLDCLVSSQGRLPAITGATAMTSKTANEKGQKDEDDIDVDDLLTQLSAEELEMLSKEVDPDVRDDFFVSLEQRLSKLT